MGLRGNATATPVASVTAACARGDEQGKERVVPGRLRREDAVEADVLEPLRRRRESGDAEHRLLAGERVAFDEGDADFMHASL